MLLTFFFKTLPLKNHYARIQALLSSLYKIQMYTSRSAVNASDEQFLLTGSSACGNFKGGHA